MDVADRLGLREGQQVVVAPQVAVPVGEAVTAVFRLAEGVPLNHGAHRAVEQQDPAAE